MTPARNAAEIPLQRRWGNVARTPAGLDGELRCYVCGSNYLTNRVRWPG